MKIIGLSVAFLIAACINTIINGFTLSVLWSWFMVPTFGAPQLSIPSAIGVAIIAGMLVYNGDSDNEDDSYMSRIASATISTTVRCAIYMACGWITLQFMGV